MKLTPESLEQLAEVQRFQAGAWQQVVDFARQYAMMKLTGSYLEDGRRIAVHFSDRKRYADAFKANLLAAAETAAAEDMMVGATMQKAKQE